MQATRDHPAGKSSHPLPAANPSSPRLDAQVAAVL
jgi:hypothetical protein